MMANQTQLRSITNVTSIFLAQSRNSMMCLELGGCRQHIFWVLFLCSYFALRILLSRLDKNLHFLVIIKAFVNDYVPSTQLLSNNNGSYLQMEDTIYDEEACCSVGQIRRTCFLHQEILKFCLKSIQTRQLYLPQSVLKVQFVTVSQIIDRYMRQIIAFLWVTCHVILFVEILDTIDVLL